MIYLYVSYDSANGTYNVMDEAKACHYFNKSPEKIVQWLERQKAMKVHDLVWVCDSDRFNP